MPATLLCVCVHRFSVLHNVQHPVCDTRGQLPTPSDGGTREKLQAAWPPSPRAVCVYSVHAKAAISLINCSTNLPTERHTENAKKAIGGNSAQTETGRKKHWGRNVRPGISKTRTFPCADAARFAHSRYRRWWQNLCSTTTRVHAENGPNLSHTMDGARGWMQFRC